MCAPCWQIRHYESDEKSNALRKEYLALERAQQGLQKDADALREELAIASLDPKEANNKFTARVNDFKAGAKHMEERAAQVRVCSYNVHVRGYARVFT
jgi:FtsZ-binding cell division protein ZapB